ncbi:hypothetical protein DKX38_013637 [Salix brachista]|uniref:Tyrosine-protein kinase catalytic domain-containing protein n=1 Tax=Salix brachista TaxID=2182728 RepID=A0A5N5LD86_9ROSI|nr:hypothetical protein DKX38_013637 [Salix brachista]
MTRLIVQKTQAIQVDPAELLHLNNLKSQLKVLEPCREVLVPTKFSCLGQFFQAAFNYTVQENSTIDLSDIACRIFEGLAKPGTLFEENTSEENNVEMGTKLRVPLKCACQDNFSNGSGVKYLVTYPLVEGDEPSILIFLEELTRQIIDHINILNLLGVCYGENDYSWSDLVFELPGNGCLRDLLSNSSNPLRWDKRIEIAFDIATDWREKMTNIRANPAAVSSRGTENIENVKGWAAPEYVVDGSVSEKVDIFAFGVALLELISGKDDVDGKSFKECIAFLGRKTTEGGCFDGLRSLKEDYPLPEALCLAVLAKACVDEEDPLHKPYTDDILKVLVRMVR